MTLAKRPRAVQIPPDLYERIERFEGGKYTPRSVVITAIEEWLNEREKASAPADAPSEGLSATAVRP